MVRFGLERDLVRALFCGLPNKDKRVAVFISVSDESADHPLGTTHGFFYGGYSAPLDVWEGYFAEAWEDRVLKGPPGTPRIKYVHMSEMFRHDWCAKNGMTRTQLDDRLMEAARVLRSTGALVPVIWDLDQEEYDQILRQDFRPAPGRKRQTLDPDYICYQFWAFTQLHLLHERHGSEVEKVDFWVEENQKIAKHIQVFHEQLIDGLQFIGYDHLIPLVGRLRPIEKERIPAQAADVLAWHARNLSRGALDREGQRRYWRMVTGDVPSGRNRFGRRESVSSDMLRELARSFARRLAGDVSVDADDPSV